MSSSSKRTGWFRGCTTGCELRWQFKSVGVCIAVGCCCRLSMLPSGARQLPQAMKSMCRGLWTVSKWQVGWRLRWFGRWSLWYRRPEQ